MEKVIRDLIVYKKVSILEQLYARKKFLKLPFPNSFHFLCAVRTRNIDLVKLIHALMPNSRRHIRTQGNAPIREAVKAGNIELVKFLIWEGANPATHSNEPLRFACRTGNLELVKIILECGVNPFFPVSKVLQECIIGGSISVLRHLSEKTNGEIIRDTAEGDIFFTACNWGRLEIIRFLIESGSKFEVKPEYRKWRLGFYKLIDDQNLPCIEYLIEKYPGFIDENSIYYATINRLEIAKFLFFKTDTATRSTFYPKGRLFQYLGLEQKKYFSDLKVWRRWRLNFLKSKILKVVLPLYYSPGFPGSLKGKFSLEEFVGEMKEKKPG